LANRIYGSITDSTSNDAPIGGLRIQIWDSDWIGSDDFLGQTSTSIDGHYEFQYSTGYLDESMGIFRIDRPDLYITVENKNSAGQWVFLKKSEIYKNHNINEDLKIDLSIEFGKPVIKRTDFIPAVNGFHFINSFVIKPDLLGIDFGTWNMGLCGGMCAGALNRYTSGITTPDETEHPKSKTPLFSELVKRQVKSMVGKTLALMLEWQRAPDITGSVRKKSIAQLTREQWNGLREALDNEIPTILVLIRTSGYLGNPTDNHQVLAVGYDYQPATQEVSISFYDPNIPEETQTLSMNIGLPGGILDLVDSSSSRTRGFFVNPQGEDAAGTI
jgi:hypothetical protein